MLKKLLETKVGQVIPTAEFKEIMQMTSDDIKFNFIGFGKKAHLDDVMLVAVICFEMIEL